MAALRIVALVAVLCAAAAPSARAADSIKLGFLLPSTTGSAEAAIPARLANEWHSAARVAVEVLNGQYTEFQVEPIYMSSDCDFAKAQDAALKLAAQGVAGIVGPACTDSARGASKLPSDYKLSIISFAATNGGLVNHSVYPYFFRTAYGDKKQKDAFGTVLHYFDWPRVAILYFSGDSYGEGLSYDIQQVAKSGGSRSVQMLTIDGREDTDFDKVYSEFDITSPPIMVLVMNPKDTETLFSYAVKKNYTKYPWWYLGSDGVTAFDLVGEVDPIAQLVTPLQGEMGVAPYGGILTDPACTLYSDYWKQQSHDEYPGLLTLDVTPRFDHTRAYVPYLWDAVRAYFEVFKTLTENNVPVVSEQVTTELSDGYWGGFNGCTGKVQFEPKTGERQSHYGAGEKPIFDFVNLIGYAWEKKAEVKEDGASLAPQDLLRPCCSPATARHIYAPAAPQIAAAPEYFQNDTSTSSPPPADGSFTPPPLPQPGNSPPVTTSSKKKGSDNGGTIAGIIVALVVAAAIAAVGVWYYRKKKREQDPQFVRML
eukprot:SM000058S18485  [mRNA]  locus=s58:116900:120996:- [translate_table: standard]